MSEKPGMFPTWAAFARFLAVLVAFYAVVGVLALKIVWALMGTG